MEQGQETNRQTTLSGIVTAFALAVMGAVCLVGFVWGVAQRREEGMLTVFVAIAAALVIVLPASTDHAWSLAAGRRMAAVAVLAAFILAAAGLVSTRVAYEDNGGLRSDSAGQSWSATRLLTAPSGAIEHVVAHGLALKRCVHCVERVTVKGGPISFAIHLDSLAIGWATDYEVSTVMQLKGADEDMLLLFESEADPQQAINRAAVRLMETCLSAKKDGLGSLSRPDPSIIGFEVACEADDRGIVGIGPLMFRPISQPQPISDAADEACPPT